MKYFGIINNASNKSMRDYMEHEKLINQLKSVRNDLDYNTIKHETKKLSLTGEIEISVLNRCIKMACEGEGIKLPWEINTGMINKV